MSHPKIGKPVELVRTPYASGESNLAVTKFKPKLISRTVIWLTAINKYS